MITALEQLDVLHKMTLPVPNASRDTYDVNINGSVDLTDKFTMYTSLNARIQNTDNFVSSGYGSLTSQTLASGGKDS